MTGPASVSLVDPRPQPLAEPGVTVLSGPVRAGSELRWRGRTADGTPIVVAQLLPELSRDVPLRRRWLRDVQRVRELSSSAVARTLRIGPDPDPTDPSAPPPWRVREDPPGETVEELLARRSPLPPGEAAELVARIADAIGEVHAEGAVLRDVAPRRLLVGTDGAVRLLDIGLTRVDILSTRTAASLILEGSAYASPEQIERTAVDPRSDVYGLGVLLFRALTGELPHGDTPAILRSPEPPPAPSQLRPAIGRDFDDVVLRCLATDPADRPDTAAELAAILRGERRLQSLPSAAHPCQSCGASMPIGQRLCLRCGKVAVRFAHTAGTTAGSTDESGDGSGDGSADARYEVRLERVDEHAQTMEGLRTRLHALARGPLPPLNFLVGDQRMYSRRERDRLLRLPVALFDQLDRETAEALKQRIAGSGLRVTVAPEGKMVRPPRALYGAVGAASIAILGTLVVVGSSAAVLAAVSVAFLAVFVLMGVLGRRRLPKHRSAALLRLRPAAAALPASDPLVRRLAGLLRPDTPADVRDHVGRLALAVQRLVDHRAEHLGEASEIDAVTEPVAKLVELCEVQVRRIAAIDTDLATLDEGALVRELAAASARAGSPTDAEGRTRDVGTDAQTSLARLDRLRTLEDERARAFHRLLEASSLIHRAVELGLSVRDERLEHERQIRLALAALGEPSDTG